MEHKEDKKRNKGGRPQKEATEKLKYRVAVKLATADYYRLLTQAHEAGVSPSEYMRECFRNGRRNTPDAYANSAAWRTTSTNLRTRLTPEASRKSVGIARWRWQGFMN